MKSEWVELEIGNDIIEFVNVRAAIKYGTDDPATVTSINDLVHIDIPLSELRKLNEFVGTRIHSWNDSLKVQAEPLMQMGEILVDFRGEFLSELMTLAEYRVALYLPEILDLSALPIDVLRTFADDLDTWLHTFFTLLQTG